MMARSTDSDIPEPFISIQYTGYKAGKFPMGVRTYVTLSFVTQFLGLIRCSMKIEITNKNDNYRINMKILE